MFMLVVTLILGPFGEPDRRVIRHVEYFQTAEACDARKIEWINTMMATPKDPLPPADVRPGRGWRVMSGPSCVDRNWIFLRGKWRSQWEGKSQDATER